MNHEVPRYLVKYYHGCFYEGFFFQMRLMFKLVDSVKEITLPNAGSPHSISWNLNRTKRLTFSTVKEFPAWMPLNWDTGSSWISNLLASELTTPLAVPVLRLECTIHTYTHISRSMPSKNIIHDDGELKITSCVHAQLLQLCLSLCYPMDYSPPGSSVHEIFQSKLLEWIAMSSSKGYLQPRDRTSVQFSSVTQSCLTLCDLLNCRMPGFPVHHQLLELTQTHVHRVGDAIQPSHPLSSPLPPALSLSQHQGLFQWVSSSNQVAKVLEFQLHHQSLQWTFRTDFL